MNLKDFTLLGQDENSYTIGHPKGKSMTIPKQGLSDKAQQLISKLKKHENFDEGGEAGDGMPLTLPETQLPPSSVDQMQARQSLSDPPMSASDEQAANPNQEPPTEQDIMSDYQNAQNQSGPVNPGQPQQSALPNNAAGLQNAKHLIQGGISAQNKAGNEQANILQDYSDQLESGKTADEDYADHQAKSKVLLDAIQNGKVDPNRVWHNASTGGKISAALGLILGGIGAGLTHGPNLALQVLNKTIDDDIDSQRTEQSKNMNLYKLNEEEYGNATRAKLATKAQMLTSAKAQLQASAAKTQGPLAGQAAAQGLAAIDQQIATTNWLNSRMGNGSPGTEQQFLGEQQAIQQIRPDLYKDRQAKYLPGVGISKVAIPQKDQDGLRGYDELLGAIDDAQAFHQQGTVAGAAGIGTAAYQTAQTKNNNITLAMNKLHGLNRINDHEYTNYKSNTPDTGSFFTAGTNAKFDELRRQVQAQKQNDTLHFGITPFQKGFSDKTAMAWAQQNPNDPRAKAIMQGQGIQ